MKMDEIRSLIEEDKKLVNNLNELNDLKVKYLGKKGLITELNQEIRNIPNEEKKEFGQKVNELRTLFNDFYEEKKTYFEEEILNEKLKNEAIDITLPSKRVKRGSKHPMTRITEQFEDLFVSMGYTVYEGPEIESDENCFQKLNLPKGHPARDAQDTFYLKDEYEKDYFLKIKDVVRKEYNNKTIFPPASSVFKALELSDYDKVKFIHDYIAIFSFIQH